MSRYLAIHSIEYTKNGVRTEGAPNTVIEGLDAKTAQSLLDGEHIRELTDAEDALHDRQNPKAKVADVKGSQTKEMKEPPVPNGPGGASGEDTSGKGDGSVASDTDTVAAAAAAKTAKPAAKSKVKRDDDI